MTTLRICMEKYIDKYYSGARISFHDYRNKNNVYDKKNPVYEVNASPDKQDPDKPFLVGCSPYCIIQLSRGALCLLTEFERQHKMRMILFMDGSDISCRDERLHSDTSYRLAEIIGDDNYKITQLPVPNQDK